MQKELHGGDEDDDEQGPAADEEGSDEIRESTVSARSFCKLFGTHPDRLEQFKKKNPKLQTCDSIGAIATRLILSLD